MKLQDIFLFVILLASFQINFAQAKPKAELIGEFPNLACDPLLLNTDSFLSLLQNEPAATGYIIVHGEKDKNLQNFRYEQLLKNAVKIRQFDIDRIVFARGGDEVELRIQLWKIPAGGDKPIYIEGRWSYMLSDIKKPFIFYKTSAEDDICPPNTDLELYSKILLANPDFRGHLVISESSAAKFRAAENKILRELVVDNKVPRNQVKSFYVKNTFTPDIELWIVPSKRK